MDSNFDISLANLILIIAFGFAYGLMDYLRNRKSKSNTRKTEDSTDWIAKNNQDRISNHGREIDNIKEHCSKTLQFCAGDRAAVRTEITEMKNDISEIKTDVKTILRNGHGNKG